MRVDAERPTRAAPSPPDPFLGQILGGCRIDEVIGRGGMGVVYKATQLSLNRPVGYVGGNPFRPVSRLSLLPDPAMVEGLEGR